MQKRLQRKAGSRLPNILRNTVFFFDFFEIDVFEVGFNFLYFQALAQVSEEAHIPVGDPDEGEKCEQITAPVVVEQFETGDHQKNQTDIVAEAVFASEKVEKLALEKRFGSTADILAIFSRFPENLLVGDCPGDAGNRNGDKKEMDYLCV